LRGSLEGGKRQKATFVSHCPISGASRGVAWASGAMAGVNRNRSLDRRSVALSKEQKSAYVRPRKYSARGATGCGRIERNANARCLAARSMEFLSTRPLIGEGCVLSGVRRERRLPDAELETSRQKNRRALSREVFKRARASLAARDRVSRSRRGALD